VHLDHYCDYPGCVTRGLRERALPRRRMALRGLALSSIDNGRRPSPELQTLLALFWARRAMTLNVCPTSHHPEAAQSRDFIVDVPIETLCDPASADRERT
jgi:hypothetical protein